MIRVKYPITVESRVCYNGICRKVNLNMSKASLDFPTELMFLFKNHLDSIVKVFKGIVREDGKR
jgi:hypothetical protein